VKLIRRGRRVVAELSIDRVQFRAGERTRVFYELEMELKKAGTFAELVELERWLAKEWNLKPEREGKFVRAVEFMRGAS
jgi:inorganic triphosphatase YgiF